MSSDEEDTSIREAFRKASVKKLAKQAAKRKQREKAKEERLAKVRERLPAEALAERPPEPIVPEQTGAALLVQTQQFMQNKTARENKIRELARIATRGEKAVEKPPAIEAEPKPITPDDPRVRNGTLAPSPKVARHLEPDAAEARRREGANYLTGLYDDREAERGRPLQTSPYPEGYLDQLENGTPEAILAGRDLSKLNEFETAAYDRAMARRLESGRPKEILAGRRRKDLQGEELDAYKRALIRYPEERRKGSVGNSAARRPSARFRRTPLGYLIDEYRIPLGLKTTDLAELAGLKIWRLHNLIAYAKPHPEEIEAIRAALDIPEEKLVLNGISEPKAERKTEKPDDHSVQSAVVREWHASRPLEAKYFTPAEGDLPYQLRIKELVRKTQWRVAWISERSGVGRDALRDMLVRPGYRIGTDKLAKVAAAFGKTLADIDPTRIGEPRRDLDPSLLLGEPPAGIVKPTIAELVEKAVSEGVAAAAISAPSMPKPPIEKGIPIPVFAVRSDWYRWEEMGKGDSFLAECPAGLAWEAFQSRFLKLADRMAEKLAHWYVNEVDDKAQTIRIWRII